MILNAKFNKKMFIALVLINGWGKSGRWTDHSSNWIKKIYYYLTILENQKSNIKSWFLAVHRSTGLLRSSLTRVLHRRRCEMKWNEENQDWWKKILQWIKSEKRNRVMNLFKTWYQFLSQNVFHYPNGATQT